MVCTFFIAFLHNSCNFQYLILGWSTLVLSPSIGHDTGNAMTLEVTVTVKQGCSELKEMAQLKMNIKTQIGEEFISVKELTQRLENFLVHDFLPHEVVQQTHGKYTEIEFVGSISFDIVDAPPNRDIEPWPSDDSCV